MIATKDSGFDFGQVCFELMKSVNGGSFENAWQVTEKSNRFND